MFVYKKFAFVYDVMGADQHSLRMVNYTKKIIRKFKIKAVTGLDLCCGTGSAIEKFLEQGMIMAGMDRSPEMLAVAMKKLMGRNVTLYKKELPRFKLLDDFNSTKCRKFDLVTCFYDSLNYLKNEKELKATFRSVYRHLQPGGWFIFDMNTAPALKVLWSGQVYADARDDLAWVWRNEYNDRKKSAKCHATFFVKEGDHWERFDEVHTEYAYDNSAIKRILREAGFTVKGFYRCFSFEQPTTRTYRICGVAQKK